MADPYLSGRISFHIRSDPVLSVGLRSGIFRADLLQISTFRIKHKNAKSSCEGINIYSQFDFMSKLKYGKVILKWARKGPANFEWESAILNRISSQGCGWDWMGTLLYNIVNFITFYARKKDQIHNPNSRWKSLTVLRIWIRSDRHHFAGSGSASPLLPDMDWHKVVAVQIRSDFRISNMCETWSRIWIRGIKTMLIHNTENKEHQV